VHRYESIGEASIAVEKGTTTGGKTQYHNTNSMVMMRQDNVEDSVSWCVSELERINVKP
jgi:hypothetical protein